MWITRSPSPAVMASSAVGDVMTDSDTISAALGMMTRRPVLSAAMCLIQRDSTTVQIGIDPDRRILIRDAPPGTCELLAALTGEQTLAEVAGRLAARMGISAHTWDPLMQELDAAGFLTNGISRPSGTDDPTRSRRWEAVAVVVGSGRVATSIGTLLAAAGVGHVHLDPHRALRPSDVTPAGLAIDQIAELNLRQSSAGDPADGRPRTARPRKKVDQSRPEVQQPRRADRDALAAMIRRVSPAVNVHSPSGYVPPDLVVLATDGPPDQVQARALVVDRLPHLAVRAGEVRGVVGPFVLPGRSSCLHCHDLHRRDADPGWPQVLLALQRAAPVPPVVLATSVAAAGADQALQFLDGRRVPDSVNGTLELNAGDWVVRRRSWRAHPACFCQMG